MVDFNASDTDRVTAKIIDCYLFATTPIYIKRTFHASGLSSIIFMCFRPPGILSYQFSPLEPYDASSPPYIEFNWNFALGGSETTNHLKKKSY